MTFKNLISSNEQLLVNKGSLYKWVMVLALAHSVWNVDQQRWRAIKFWIWRLMEDNKLLARLLFTVALLGLLA